jgi:cobalt-zinc-cadmium efflux system outer membrane protein
MRKLMVFWLIFAVGCQDCPRPLTGDVGARRAVTAPVQTVSDVVPARAENVVGASPPTAGSLDLPALWNLALANNPSLRETEMQLEAARGRLIQAGLYPNPQFNYEQEEIGEAKEAAGTIRLFVVQEVVTAGKRRLDLAVAERGLDAASLALLGRRFEVLTRIRRAYYDYAGLVLALEADQEVVHALEQAAQTIRRLVEEAKTRPATDLIRIEALLEEARISLVRDGVRVEGAWQQLAAEIGTPQLPVPSLDITPKLEWGRDDQAANRDTVPELDRQVVHERVLTTNTVLRQAAVEAERARWEFERAKAEAVPNVKVGGGYVRNFPEAEAGAMITVQSPLPLWDRKQGQIHEARARWAQALAAERATATRLSAETSAAFTRYRAAGLQAERLIVEVIPRLRKNRELLEKGYQAGANLVTFSDVLLAEESLNSARLTLAEARRNLWLAVAELEGLMQLDVGEALRN